LLSSRLSSKALKIKAYKTKFQTCFWCEIYSLTFKKETKVLRKIYGPKKDESNLGYYVYIISTLVISTSHLSVLKMVKRGLLLWAVHVEG